MFRGLWRGRQSLRAATPPARLGCPRAPARTPSQAAAAAAAPAGPSRQIPLRWRTTPRVGPRAGGGSAGRSSSGSNGGSSRTTGGSSSTARAAAPILLRSGIYGTVYLSIALLVTDESLDWGTRQSAATQVVQDVTGAPDHETQLRNFWALGPALLQAHAGGGSVGGGGGDDDGANGTATEVVVRHHEGGLQPAADSGFEGELDVRLMTAPDPETPGGTLVLCQAAFMREEEPEFYVATHHDRMLDAAMALIPSFEDFARTCAAPTRGAMLVLYPDGNWYCLYFDGRRWLNMIFLEWQTAETMGFH